MLGDVGALARSARLGGAPAAAFEDCSRLAGGRFGALHAATPSAYPSAVGYREGPSPRAPCDLHTGLMMINLMQWQRMDLTSRVEYALSLNLRASPTFGFGDADAPLLFALRPVYSRLPLFPLGSEEGGGGGSSEGGAWRVVVFDDGGGIGDGIGGGGIGGSVGASTDAGGGGTLVVFTGDRKPWLRSVLGTGGNARTVRQRQAEALWSRYAIHLASAAKLERPTLASGGRRGGGSGGLGRGQRRGCGPVGAPPLGGPAAREARDSHCRRLRRPCSLRSVRLDQLVVRPRRR